MCQCCNFPPMNEKAKRSNCDGFKPTTNQLVWVWTRFQFVSLSLLARHRANEKQLTPLAEWIWLDISVVVTIQCDRNSVTICSIASSLRRGNFLVHSVRFEITKYVKAAGSFSLTRQQNDFSCGAVPSSVCRQNIPKQRANITLYKYESIIHVVLHESFFHRFFFRVRNQNEIRWMWVRYMLCYLCNGWTGVNRYGHIFCVRSHTYNSYFALNICLLHFAFRYESAETHTHTHHHEHMQIRHGMGTFSQCVFWVFNYVGV